MKGYIDQVVAELSDMLKNNGEVTPDTIYSLSNEGYAAYEDASGKGLQPKTTARIVAVHLIADRVARLADEPGVSFLSLSPRAVRAKQLTAMLSVSRQRQISIMADVMRECRRRDSKKFEV